jgi:hypothetical protein
VLIEVLEITVESVVLSVRIKNILVFRINWLQQVCIVMVHDVKTHLMLCPVLMSELHLVEEAGLQQVTTKLKVQEDHAVKCFSFIFCGVQSEHDVVAKLTD